MKRKPYIAAHNQLLSHSGAVKLYRAKYQETQGGKIGITISTDYKQPHCQNPNDREAAERGQIFQFAWFVDPILKGDYPQVMRDRVGSRLPSFTEQQKKEINGSVDFLGLNHYTTYFVSASKQDKKPRDLTSDVNIDEKPDMRFQEAESTWLYTIPFGLRKLLNWIKDRYDNPPIIITENGFSQPFENQLTDSRSLQDHARIEYLQGYIAEMYKAIAFDGVDVKGYFVWSLMDNFEWADGYIPRFGLVRVNYTSQERFPKNSALVYKALITRFSGGGTMSKSMDLPPTRSLQEL